MDWPLTNRPSGAVGAEGAGSGCLSAGEKGEGGPRPGRPPAPHCAADFAARYGGRGRRRKPGSVAVWTGAPSFGVHGRTPWPRSQRPPPARPLWGNTNPLRRRNRRWTYICLGLFRLHWNMAWRDDDEPRRHSKQAKSPPPSCRRCNRLARASFSGSAIKVPFADPSSDARRGGAQFGRLWEAAQIEARTRGAGPCRCPGTGGTLCGQWFCLRGISGGRGF
jgi:hypothetical protein